MKSAVVKAVGLDYIYTNENLFSDLAVAREETVKAVKAVKFLFIHAPNPYEKVATLTQLF